MTRAISSSAARNGCGIRATARSTSRSKRWWRDAGRIGHDRDPRRRFGMAPVSYGSMDADPAAVPEGYLVTADDGTRLHFQDWGGPDAAADVGVLLVPGLLQP